MKATLQRSKIETAAMLITGAMVFMFCVQVDAFEWLYQQSRLHEGWKISQLASLTIAVAITLPGLLYVNRQSLNRALADKRRVEISALKAARHDPLTGLHNRRFLTEQLEAMIAQLADGNGLIPGIALLNVNRFKPINDVHGHAVGDIVLQHVAERVAGSCLPGQIPVRFGGDVFAVLFDLGSTGESDVAFELALRIKSALNDPISVTDLSTIASCRCGIATWRADQSPTQLIQDAEQAMYRATQSGQGQIAFYDQESSAALRDKASIEVDLRQAILEQQIQPYFQPIFCLQSHQIIGCEVLARWQCPTRGFVMPDQFISIAEDCGLIAQFTWDLMARALGIALTWPVTLSVSFNVSPIQFHDEAFVKQLQDLLQTVGYPPELLVLEITESGLIADVACAQTIFKDLRALGVRLSLDDFGTGYSSLAILNDLQFDNLKIDRSFVTGLTDGSQSAKITDGILALAKSLDLSVTAEGIENQSELAFLCERHCPMGQGYLFARPLPTADLAVFLEQQLFPPQRA